MENFDFDEMPSTYEPAARGILAAFRAGETVILSGQRGSGITMVAKRAAKFLGEDRPFRSPHHTLSLAGMRGSVNGDLARAGELSMAEDGLLFLEDAQEWPRRILDAVAVVMKAGEVVHPTGHSFVTLSGAPAGLMLSVSFEAQVYSAAIARVSKGLSDRGLAFRVVHMPIYDDAKQYHRSLAEKRCTSTAGLMAEI